MDSQTKNKPAIDADSRSQEVSEREQDFVIFWTRIVPVLAAMLVISWLIGRG